jgi:DNA polymerase-3 subunit chi
MPIRADFYLLKQSDENAQLLTVCRIIQKAYLNSHQIYIHTQNSAQSETLDRLLWTFDDISFVPHQILSSTDERENSLPAVLIGHAASPSLPVHDVLLNLDHKVPDFFNTFERIIEVVPEEPAARTNAREKYRFYRQHQCELYSHTL